MILRNPTIRSAFMEGLNELVAGAPIQVVACAIHKRRYVDRYADPVNPYHLAVRFGLERLYQELQGRGCRSGRAHILFERRGGKEDAELELEFRRIRDGDNWLGTELPFEAVFCEKKANSSGLQLADLIARPIGRKILAPAQPNRAWEIVETKLRRSPAGRTHGWGLKLFP